MIDWYDLNARHEAALLWGAAFLAFALAKSPDVRKSIGSLLKMLPDPPIIALFIGLFVIEAALATVAVVLGRFVGLWTTLPIVTVSIWSVTSGISLLMDIGKFLEEDRHFIRKARAVLTPAIVLTALINIAILSFWWEFALVPFLQAFAVLSVYGSRNHNERPLQVANVPLLLYLVVLLSLAIKGIVEDPGTWKSLVQAAILPLWLTIGTLPYIQCWILVERWQFRHRGSSKAVNSTDYGEDWPFIVDSAKLCCKHRAVWVEIDGKMYGLNGTAKGMLPRRGHTSNELEEIWRDDPKFEEWSNVLGDSAGGFVPKVSVHRLIQDGLALEGT